MGYNGRYDTPQTLPQRKPHGQHPGNELLPAFVRNVSRAGRYCDGQGLYLDVHPYGSVPVDAQRERISPRFTDPSRNVLGGSGVMSMKPYGRREHVFPKRYVRGESLFYLGRRYQLKVQSQNGTGPSVKLVWGQIGVTSRSKDPARIRKQLADWYRTQLPAPRPIHAELEVRQSPP